MDYRFNPALLKAIDRRLAALEGRPARLHDLEKRVHVLEWNAGKGRQPPGSSWAGSLALGDASGARAEDAPVSCTACADDGTPGGCPECGTKFVYGGPPGELANREEGARLEIVAFSDGTWNVIDGDRMPGPSPRLYRAMKWIVILPRAEGASRPKIGALKTDMGALAMRVKALESYATKGDGDE